MKTAAIARPTSPLSRLLHNGDLFLTAEFPPAIKVDGKVTKVSPQPLTRCHGGRGFFVRKRARRRIDNCTFVDCCGQRAEHP